MNQTWITLMLLSCCFACELRSQEQKLEADDFARAIDHAAVQLLDVRTSGEFARGHIKGAMQADWNDRAEFEERTKALDKSTPLYIYCAAGPRSDAAGEWLSQRGFMVIHLKGGLAAWRRGKKEVVANNNIGKQEQVKPEDFMAQLPKDKPVLVDMGADWCPPCRKMLPVIDSLETKSDGRYVIIRVDVTAQPDLAEFFRADSYPTFILFRNGQEAWRQQGIVSLETLQSALLNP